MALKKSTYKSVDDFLILAKFSDFQYIFNKSAQRTNYATKLLTLEPKYMDVPVLENKLKSDFENNKRSYLSSIASIVLVKNNTVEGKSKLRSILGNRNKSSLLYNLTTLSKLNITNIFVIDGNVSSYYFPRFNRLHYFNKDNDIKYLKDSLNYLSLFDFCLLVSTLIREKNKIKNIKVDISDA